MQLKGFRSFENPSNSFDASRYANEASLLSRIHILISGSETCAPSGNIPSYAISGIEPPFLNNHNFPKSLDKVGR